MTMLYAHALAAARSLVNVTVPFTLQHRIAGQNSRWRLFRIQEQSGRKSQRQAAMTHATWRCFLSKEKNSNTSSSSQRPLRASSHMVRAVCS